MLRRRRRPEEADFLGDLGTLTILLETLEAWEATDL
jgi:hypothetical protein